MEGVTMQIMTILGSPRRRGNTAQVLGWIDNIHRGRGETTNHTNHTKKKAEV